VGAPAGRIRAAGALLGALALLTVAACAAHQPIRVVLYPEDDGGRQVVPLKSRLAIALDDPGTPGYAWTGLEWDRTLLRADGRMPAGAFPEVKGDPERTVLFFEAVAVGITDLTLAYCVPAACERTTQKTYRVKVKVMKGSEIGKAK
jgi:hypothetical protein